MSNTNNQESAQLSSINIYPKKSLHQIINLISNTGKTFIFQHNNSQYNVNPIVACFYSRKINCYLMGNPFFEEYKVPNYDGNFQIIVDYFQTNKIEINKENALFIFNVGCDLQIDSIIDMSVSYIPEDYFLTNKNNILQNLYFSGSSMKKVLSLLSSHFNELISTKFLEKLPISFISLILSSPNLNVEPQDLLKFLSKFFNWKKNPNHALAKYLPLQIIPKDEIREYLNDYRLNFNHLRINFFNSLQISDNKINFSDHNAIYAELPQFLNDDKIIIPGLLKKIPRESILLSSKSVAYPTDMQENYGPEILLSEDSQQYFCTQQGENEYLEISFTDFEVRLEGYLLRSWKGASNKVCPVSWNLEASNDGKDWSIIDHKDYVQDLMKDNGIYISPIEETNYNYYKFFRFVQLSTGNEGNSVLALSGFELYGGAKI